MTTLVPRKPYSQEELDKLYPNNLELRLVQVLLRHGERAPVSVRFQNVGEKYKVYSVSSPEHRQAYHRIGHTAMQLSECAPSP